MMEEVLFPESKPIGKRLRKGYVEARLHTDTKSPQINAILALQKDLAKTKAIPTFVVLDPGTGKVLARISGYMKEAKFLEFLEKARTGT